MPISEAPNDARDLVRVRFTTGLTDHVAGVDLVRGEAQNGCTPAVAERLRAIFGHVVEIVRPWSDPVPPPAALTVTPEPPAEPVEFAREASPLEGPVAPPAASDAAPASDATTVTARAPRRRAR